MADRMSARQGREERTHLFELDLIRSVTALAVVGVHVSSFTLVLAHGASAQLLQNGVVSALHFTREIFLTITAFVMVYIYGGKRFSPRTFWRKRGIGVLVPYVAWTLFYDWRTKPPLAPLPWLWRALGDVVWGTGSFQLYYILLSLELYLILPWLLAFIAWAGKHPWRTLAISFVVQVVFLALDYHYVQAPSFASTPIGNWVNTYQGRFLPLYQFYVVLGGVAALYMRQVQAFLRRHGAWTLAGLALGLALLEGNLLYQNGVTHAGIAYGIAVFQPAMAVYALVVAAAFYWLASRWAQARAPRPPRVHRFWLELSNASFGIYLMHAYVLDIVMFHVVPHLRGVRPEALAVLGVWVLVAGGTAAICVVFLYVPGLSRLIGRPCALRRDVGVGRWLDERLAPARPWLDEQLGQARRAYTEVLGQARRQVAVLDAWLAPARAWRDVYLGQARYRLAVLTARARPSPPAAPPEITDSEVTSFARHTPIAADHEEALGGLGTTDQVPSLAGGAGDGDVH